MTTQLKDSQAVREKVNEVADEQRNELTATGWWHSIDLGNGLIAPGVHKIEELRDNYARFNLPEEMTGLRVLDIGCWDGFYAFESERRGAEVVAVDCWRPEKFFEAHRLLNSKIVFHEMSVYEVTRKKLGSFDIVLFLGVLYHLRHPLLALERVCEVTRDIAVIESHVIDQILETPRPVMEFYEIDELGGQYDNWWGPNSECLVQMARSGGFVRTEVLRREPTRAAIKAYRHYEKTPSAAAPSLQIREVINACTVDHRYPITGRHAYLAAIVEGMPQEVKRQQVRVSLGGFDTFAVYVGPSGNPQHAGWTQITAPVPPGLEAGRATLRISYEDRISPELVLDLTEGSEW